MTSTTYEEWRVTGDANGGGPDIVWSPVGPLAWKFPENEARNFVRSVESRGGWPNGPRLHRRTVTVTAWEPVDVEPSHDYLSTGCLHGRHDYCKGQVGQAGLKTPGQCKFCDARCTCACHN